LIILFCSTNSCVDKLENQKMTDIMGSDETIGKRMRRVSDKKTIDFFFSINIGSANPLLLPKL
jgi:hypothetical protein